MNLKKAVLKISETLIVGTGGAVLGAGMMNRVTKKSIDQEIQIRKRYQMYYGIVTRCLILKNDGKSLCEYFRKNGIKKIAVYGVGTMASILYNELCGSEVEIMYFIDKQAQEFTFGLGDIKVCTPDEISGNECPDAVIVTPVADYDCIKEDLSEYTDARIISFETVVDNV